MAEMPPAYGLGVFDGEDLANGTVLEEKFTEKHVVRTVA